MDGDIEEAQLLALAKVLSSILVVSGPHFRILAKIDSAALVSIHTSLLDSVCKLVGQHTDKGNKPKLRKALVLFKALPPLLAGAVGKDALAIHAHLAEQLEKAGVKPAGDKTWDHQRVYDKRVRGRPFLLFRPLPRVVADAVPSAPRSQLTTIMSKDSRIAKGARKQVAADEADASLSPPTSPTGATAAKGGKRKRPSQAADDDEGAAKAKKPRPKPKVRPSRAAAHKPADTIEDSDEDDKDAPAAEEEEEEQAPEEEMLNMGGGSSLASFLRSGTAADQPRRPRARSRLPHQGPLERAATAILAPERRRQRERQRQPGVGRRDQAPQPRA